MVDDLFKDLPPPISESRLIVNNPTDNISREPTPPPPPPAPALKSALKRPKSQTELLPEVAAASEKRLRFKTITDASEKQVTEAMQKIASHIKNPAKFSKASKLALQLIQAGSVKEATSSYFFSVVEAAMMFLTRCNEPSLRADYHALFSAIQDLTEVFSKEQQNLLNTWTIRAVWANDLFTDDSFVFSKAAGRIKEAIAALPIASEDEDREEAMALKDDEATVDEPTKIVLPPSASSNDAQEEEPDPFGLDALILLNGKEPEEKGKMLSRSRIESEKENRRHLKLKREVLLCCLEIAAKRYKIPWCQTTIDILSKHAFDHISRFTAKQRDAIEKLWSSIREQQTRRKQGKSVTGKLDVNAFEWLQQKYSTERISIRHSVGGGGERKCEQWLG